MRTLCLVAFALVACGDDDSTINPDVGMSDTGAPDARDAGSDAGTDSGSDAGRDAGSDAALDAPSDVFDAGPTLCDPVATGITFPSREWNAELVAESADITQPVSFAWNGTTMLISNSVSWSTVVGTDGNVLQNVAGTISVFASDAAMLGPAFVAWHPGEPSGFSEGLYMGIEDAVGPGVLQISADGTTVTTLTNGAEPGELEFGVGGDWGDDLYFTSRERPDSVMPNPFGIYTVNPAGERTLFAATEGGAALVGSYTLEFGPGGAFGDDLYVGTIEDTGFSPGSAEGLHRVTSDGTASLLADILALSIAGSADGDFGEFLYVTTRTGVSRVDASGAVEVIAEDMTNPSGLKFGPDGALYLADPAGGRMLRITRCP